MTESNIITGEAWPSLALDAWKGTYATLHMWTQMVGKIRLAQTPWTNHSWHVTLYVTPRGLTTGSIPYGTRAFQIDFDFIAHELKIQSDDGGAAGFPLQPQSVAVFYRRLREEMTKLDLDVKINRQTQRDPERHSIRSRRSSRRLRPRVRQPLLAGAFAKRPYLQNIPRALRRQVQPGALLLGRTRLGCHPILRPARSAASRRRSQSSGSSRARGLLARGQQLRLLAGRGRHCLSRVLFLRLSGTGRFCQSPDQAGVRVLQHRSAGIHSPLRRSPQGKIAGRYSSRFPADNL